MVLIAQSSNVYRSESSVYAPGYILLKDAVCKADGASLGLEAALMAGADKYYVVFMKC